MRKIVILDTYPTTDIHISTLISSIKSLKSEDFDIMLVSHLPISEEICKMVDYVIYDSENLLLPIELTPHVWVDTDSFFVKTFNNGHSLTICKNLKNGISLAHSIGYDFFYFIESDNVFSKIDLNKLIQLSYDMLMGDKKMFFFKDAENFHYETLLFGGDINFFLQNMYLATTVEDFIKHDYRFVLESTFYHKLSLFENEFLIINEKIDVYFNTSVINKFKQNGFTCRILKTNNNNYLLFIYNHINIPIQVSIDKNKPFVLHYYNWYMLPITDYYIGLGSLHLSIADDSGVHNIVFNLNKMEIYDNVGFFEFK
jgi:hypothetical protein